MNSKLLLAFLCVASLSTGCIIRDDDCCNPPPPPARPGDVTFLWTFDGLRCDEARDVYGVNITIPGEVLHNNGRFACSTNNADGITLHDFVPGSYTYRIQAVDYRNVIIFEGTGSFVINGDATVSIDMVPVGSNTNTSYAYLNWTFPGNQSCAQAGVASVDIRLNDNDYVNFPCAEGQKTPGLKTPYLAPGEHFIEFVALDSQNRPLYYFNGGMITQAYNPVYATYNLYVIGGASISWRFTDVADGSVTFDCAQLDPSGNQLVGVNFQDMATGQWVYGAIGDFHKCSTKPIVYQFLRPGTYKVSLYAKSPNGVEYLTKTNGPLIDVQAHVFPGPSAALPVTMYRKGL